MDVVIVILSEVRETEISFVILFSWNLKYGTN